MALSVPSFRLFDDLRHEFNTKPALRTLWNDAALGARGNNWRIMDNLAIMNSRVYVSPT
jgi:hypothetical protein